MAGILVGRRGRAHLAHGSVGIVFPSVMRSGPFEGGGTSVSKVSRTRSTRHTVQAAPTNITAVVTAAHPAAP